jgi:hypothetical protein
MNNLLKMVCFCDCEAVKSISQIFRNQNNLRSLLLDFIQLIESNKFKNSQIIQESGEKLCKAFNNVENVDKVINNFHHLLNVSSHKVSSLKDVFESKSITCEEAIDTIEEFFNIDQKFVDKVLLEELKNEMISRCGIALVDSNAFIILFQLMESVEQKFAKRLASLLIVLSIVYDKYFNDELVITELMRLPPIIIAFIASDSMLPFMKCSQLIKDQIKEFVAQNSSDINKSISQISL